MSRQTTIGILLAASALVLGFGAYQFSKGNTPANVPTSQIGVAPDQMPLPGAPPPASVTTGAPGPLVTPNGINGAPGTATYSNPPSAVVRSASETTTLIKENPAAVPGASSTSTATTQKTAYLTPHHVYRREVHYEHGDKIHVARATKHTIGFATKLPFRLRP